MLIRWREVPTNWAATKSYDFKVNLFLQFSGGYQPTVGVDYGFKIQHVEGVDCKYIDVPILAWLSYAQLDS